MPSKRKLFKEEKKERVFLSVYFSSMVETSVTCKIALACSILYRKTLSNSGITCFVDT